MLNIIPIPAFADNYIWLLHQHEHAIVIDPGDVAPVIKALKAADLRLSAILITHHHSDHIDGVNALLDYAEVPVYAPIYEQYSFKHQAVGENDIVHIADLDLQFKVMWLPGHTLGHIAYVNNELLFCGDTLFGAGCGRLFEGTPAQMLASLKRLKALPIDTKVYCTHEYTAKNIEFALSLEPNNIDLQTRKLNTQQQLSTNLPSLPSTIQLEIETNPFLRCQVQEIIQNLTLKSPIETSDELSIFTGMRALRNHY